MLLYVSWLTGEDMTKFMCLQLSLDLNFWQV